MKLGTGNRQIPVDSLARDATNYVNAKLQTKTVIPVRKWFETGVIGRGKAIDRGR